MSKEVLERLDALEAAIAKIGHNGGPPLDDDEPPPAPPKRKPGLLPDRLVAERYDVHVRTLGRWDKDPGLGFPKPVYIPGRRYRSGEELDQFDRDCARRVANPSPHRRAVAQALPRARAGRFNKPVAGA